MPGDVRRAASALISGIQVGSIFEQQKVFGVLVIATPETRSNLSGVQGLLVNKPGGHVPLRDVAKVQIVPTPTVIRHDAASRSVDVTASVSGCSLGAVVADVEEAVKSVGMPLEYHVELRREHVDEQGSTRRVQAIALGAAVVILLLFQAAFGSWRLAFLFWLLLPLSLLAVPWPQPRRANRSPSGRSSGFSGSSGSPPATASSSFATTSISSARRARRSGRAWCSGAPASG